MSFRIAGWIAGQMLVLASGFVAGPPGCWSSGRISPGAVMSSIGTMTWSSSGLRVPASTTVTSRPGPTPPRNRAIVSSGRWVAESPIRCGGATPVAPGDELLQAFHAQGEVGAALRAGDRMDLVDDDVLDATEDVARLAREQQIERFRGRDEDVRRAPGEIPTILGRRVAGPARDADVRSGLAEAGGSQADAGQRGAKVALDVVRQGLERRDVEDANGSGLGRRPRRGRRGSESIERPEERRECLAAAGRGMDQRVMAGRDGGPTFSLGLRRRLEGRLEPGPDGRPERGERIGDRRGCDHGTKSIGRTAYFDQMFGSFVGATFRVMRGA